MADEPLTGFKGDIKWDVSTSYTVIGHVRRFTLNRVADNAVYASSSSSQAKKATKGNRSWTLTADIYIDAGDPGNSDQKLDVMVPGALANVQLFPYETGSGAQVAEGAIRIDSIENLEVDIEGSGNISATINATGHGELVEGTVT